MSTAAAPLTKAAGEAVLEVLDGLGAAHNDVWNALHEMRKCAKPAPKTDVGCITKQQTRLRFGNKRVSLEEFMEGGMGMSFRDSVLHLPKHTRALSEAAGKYALPGALRVVDKLNVYHDALARLVAPRSDDVTNTAYWNALAAGVLDEALVSARDAAAAAYVALSKEVKRAVAAAPQGGRKRLLDDDEVDALIERKRRPAAAEAVDEEEESGDDDAASFYSHDEEEDEEEEETEEQDDAGPPDVAVFEGLFEKVCARMPGNMHAPGVAPHLAALRTAMLACAPLAMAAHTAAVVASALPAALPAAPAKTEPLPGYMALD